MHLLIMCMSLIVYVLVQSERFGSIRESILDECKA